MINSKNAIIINNINLISDKNHLLFDFSINTDKYKAYI